MSSDYFFKKWKKTLTHLDEIVEIDSFFQESKAHDKTLCEASERLCGMLAQYIAVFNEALDCKHHNAQVQKIPIFEKIIHAISERILELKNQLHKLDGSNYQYLANGMKIYKLTPYDVEFTSVPDEAPRSEILESKLKEIFKAVKEEKQRLLLEREKEEQKEIEENIMHWWEIDDAEEVFEDIVEEEKQMTEDELKTKESVALIQAHERSRQVIYKNRRAKHQRQRWVKELEGTLPPPARLELRERAAKLIQLVTRIYFEQKRKKLDECERDKFLGLQYCEPPKIEFKLKSHELKSYWTETRKKYTKDWRISFDNMKQNYLKEKAAELTEYYRDVIRDWFYSWFNEIHYFHEIPNEKEGGVVSIIKDEIPSPSDWLEEYKEMLEQQRANKGKTAQQLKFAKLEAKREKILQKREENIKLKLQSEMMKKLMKNPTQHPGYHFSTSHKLSMLIEAVEDYHNHWDNLDDTGLQNVKEKFVNELDFSDAFKEVKIEVTNYITEDMIKELKLLQAALKLDYMNMDENMLEPLKKKRKKKKKKPKLQTTMSDHVHEKLHMFKIHHSGILQDLAMKDILKEYPRTTLEDFLGDHNLIGDDIRCKYGRAFPFAGETRSVWWERCQELVHGNHKVLIVGPKGSGKTTLAHALASLNDAVLFEIDPWEIPSNLMSAAHLQSLMLAIAECAQMVQPSVIYIKHVHLLYYKKDPPVIAGLNTSLLRNYLVRKLCKKFNKTDKVTVIGTCVDPWLMKAKLLKQFPVVIPMPDTSYSTVYKILSDWITNNHNVPNDLDIQSLSRTLQGFSFGYIKECLQNFLSPERIVHIAAHGLNPIDVYNYILDDKRETKVDYEKYMNWYFDKTTWGKKEKKHHEEQLQFKAALDKYAEAMMKKKKSKSGASSAASSKLALNQNK